MICFVIAILHYLDQPYGVGDTSLEAFGPVGMQASRLLDVVWHAALPTGLMFTFVYDLGARLGRLPARLPGLYRIIILVFELTYFCRGWL
ncbi:MAG: hypothetical protein ACYCW6_10325 [Candidatus Xenobia bacterium]